MLQRFLLQELDDVTSQEVDQHASDCPDCLAVLEQLTMRTAAVLPPVTRAGDWSTRELPEVPGHEVLAWVADGGMGEVYHARELALRREVAVKVLAGRFLDYPEAHRRFAEEAHIAGQLQHPGIVPVHQHGELPDGRPYLTMKFIRGHTLAQLLADRSDFVADRPRLLAVFEQVCQTVAYAHSRRVIHRDLKPQNIMVGEFGEVQVMDWGLARGLTDSGHELDLGAEVLPDTPRRASPDWQTDHMVGTFSYAPPEQVRAVREQVDAHSDVFSLGAILCEILTGSPPYLASSREQLEALAFEGDTGPALARLAGCGADPELVGIVHTCLDPDPDRRFADANYLAAALRTYTVGVEERLRAQRLEADRQRLRAEEERKRRRLTVGLVLSLALCGIVLLLAGWYWHNQNQQHMLGQTLLRNGVEDFLERGAGLLRDGLFGQAEASLQHAEGRLGSDGNGDLRERLRHLQADLRLAGRLRQIRRATSGLIRLSGALSVGSGFDHESALRDYPEAFRSAGLDVETPDTAKLAAAIRQSEIREVLVAALDDWALNAHQLGQFPLRDRLLAVARAVDPDPEVRDRVRDPRVWSDAEEARKLAESIRVEKITPELLVLLGTVMPEIPTRERLWRDGVTRQPSDFWLNLTLGTCLAENKRLPEAVEYLRTATALEPNTAAARYNLGNVLFRLGRHEDSLREFHAAARLDPNPARIHNALGAALAEVNKEEEAEREYRAALAIRSDLPDAHTNLGNLFLTRARRFLARRDDEKFRTTIAEAIASQRKALELDPDHADARLNLGAALALSGDLEAAVKEYRRVLYVNADDAETRNNLGNVLRQLGYLAEAKQEFDELIRRRPDLAPAHLNRGQVLHEMGRLVDEVDAYHEALKLRPDYALAHGALGRALIHLGEFDAAHSSLQRCLDLLPEIHGLRAYTVNQLQLCERLQRLRPRLGDFLEGPHRPEDDRQRLDLARLCQFTGRHADAMRFYEQYLDATPGGEPNYDRLAAARCALAAAPAGAEGETRRAQAFVWLRVELAAHRRRVEAAPSDRRQATAATVRGWLDDTRMAAVREENALARLSPDERADWERFWHEVRRLGAGEATSSPSS